jgi:hypothetical protein
VHRPRRIRFGAGDGRDGRHRHGGGGHMEERSAGKRHDTGPRL